MSVSHGRSHVEAPRSSSSKNYRHYNGIKNQAIEMSSDNQTPGNYSKYFTPSAIEFDNIEGSSSSVDYRVIHNAAKNGDAERISRLIQEDVAWRDLADDRGLTPLHVAAQHNRANVIKVLLERGAQVNSVTKEDLTPLHVASRSNSVAALQVLLQNGADPSAKEALTSSTPLLLATRMGNTEAVRKLMTSRKSMTNKTDNRKMTALHLACLRGWYDICEILIEHGASLSMLDAGGMTPLAFAAGNEDSRIAQLVLEEAPKQYITIIELMEGGTSVTQSPLHIAVQAGNTTVTKLFIQNGASVNARSPGNLQTPLHIACTNGDIEMLRLLVANGSNVNSQDSLGRTPLHCACSLGRLEVIKLLLDQNPKAEVKDLNGYTPQLSAALSGQVEAVEVLILRGAEMTSRDNDMRSSLHLAVQQGRLNVVKMLLETRGKALVNVPDTKEKIPLHYAADAQDMRILNLLLCHGSDCRFKDSDQQTPLHVAVKQGGTRHVEAILQTTPACVYDRDASGRTALHYAAANKRRKICETLLRYGADVDSSDIQLRTPLFHACVSGHVITVRYLIGQHANIEHTDSEGNTALHVGAANNNTDVVKLLLNTGAKYCKNIAGLCALRAAIENNAADVVMLITKDKRWREFINPDQNGFDIMLQLIREFPDAATAVMDRCVQRSSTKGPGKSISITFDFQLLDPGPGDDKDLHYTVSGGVSTFISIPSPFKTNEKFALLEMAQKQRQALLGHPLATKLRQIKWKYYGAPVYLLNMLLFGLFLGFYTLFIFDLRATRTLHNSKPSEKGCETDDLQHVVAGVALALDCVQILKEFQQMVKYKFSYFLDLQNWLVLCTYMFALLFLLPYSFKINSLCTDSDGVIWKTGTIGLFLGYFNLILLTKNLSFLGLYVTMFIEIYKTVLRVMSVFVLFLLAFALAFYILFKEQAPFDNFWQAFCQVISMSIGELNYQTVLVDSLTMTSNSTGAPLVPYPIVSNILWAFFVVTVTIVLMNLLVGLAVGDIETIRAHAYMSRIGNQIDFLTEVETSYPRALRRMLYTPKITVHESLARKGTLGYVIEGRWLNDLHIISEPEEQVDVNVERYLDLKREITRLKDRMKLVMSALERQNKAGAEASGEK